MKVQVTGSIVSNENLQGDYYRIRFQVPEIASAAQAGQFVDVSIPGMKHRILKRPFSINDAEPESGVLTVTYKVVGEGTDELKRQTANTAVDIIGPCGRGFSAPLPGYRHVLVAGGYGCAAVYLLAKRAAVKPIVLLGGRSAGDIILADDFRAAGADVRIATDDGTLGEKGRVTCLLEPLLKSGEKIQIAACGPRPMLKAVGKLVEGRQDVKCELSIDEHFCCGVGACFGCVIKVKDESEQGWRYARSCQEGPVFNAETVYWD